LKRRGLQCSSQASRQPILQPYQHHVRPTSVGAQCTGRIEQRLEDLVVRRDTDSCWQVQVTHPERERFPDRIGSKRGGDSERPSLEECQIRDWHVGISYQRFEQQLEVLE